MFGLRSLNFAFHGWLLLISISAIVVRGARYHKFVAVAGTAAMAA